MNIKEFDLPEQWIIFFSVAGVIIVMMLLLVKNTIKTKVALVVQHASSLYPPMNNDN